MKLYCGCIKEYKVGESNITDRTHFYKKEFDAANEVIFALFSSDDDRYDKITLKKNADLNKKVYIYEIEAETEPVGGPHGAYTCKEYKLSKICYSGSANNLISRYNIKIKKKSINESMIYNYMLKSKSTSSQSINEQVLVEAVEDQIASAGSKEGLMKKFHLTDKDINVGKKFLSKNPKIAAKFKECKSIKDVIKVMKDKEVKDAMNNDKG